MSMLGLVKIDQSFLGRRNESWLQHAVLIEVILVRAKQQGSIRMEQKNEPWLQHRGAEEQEPVFFLPSSLFLFFLFLQESSVNLIYVHAVAIIYGNITFIVKEDKRKLE